MNIALGLRFCGSNYHGWQSQKNALAVEDVLRAAIKKLTGKAPVITACSRTDAGVHALSYVCNFNSKTNIPEDKMPYAFNTTLPRDIRVMWAKIVPDDFNARFGTVSKTYIYKIYNDKFSDPFLHNLAYHFPYKLNLDNMIRAARFFEGEHDFTSFMASGGSQKTTVRNIMSAVFRKDGPNIEFEITANAFLYNMVRIITGTLLCVGTGRISADDIPAIIAEKDRTKAGFTAPPDGLYLANIEYGGKV